ncbi:uncharacterized protein LOC143375009 [Andrena cerasifolii]|uniref:uncharacterized protein LOC143375009 n=1 Tax=Andrena cerasifolii TaxID=2819439 RepID=UPI004038206D
MRTSLVLLVFSVASAAAAPPQHTLSPRSLLRDKGAVSAGTEIDAAKVATNQLAKKESEEADGEANELGSPLLTSVLDDVQKQSDESKDKAKQKGRKHKALFVNYPIVPQLPFASVPYDLDYSNNFDTEERSRDPSRYQESDIFYIRLPPTPYMFVPGLGYISQPPTYSTSNLRPQVSYARPARPKPTYQSTNPFIKLPIDFVSNGKPTSVYQWQKKPAKKPTDSPITNLDSLSPEFVSNGKPTSIYQWQTNLKPIKPADDLANKLDKGPYTFNGKPTSFFLLKSDGTSSARQQLRYSGYQEGNAYY